MKAKEMTIKRDGFTFKNGDSHLVVYGNDGQLDDMVEWPGRPRQRPTSKDEMDTAVVAWFEQRHDDTVAGKEHSCTWHSGQTPLETQPYHIGDESRMLQDLVQPQHIEIEISADGKTVYVHVNHVTAFRAGYIGELVLNDHREGHVLVDVTKALRRGDKAGVHLTHCCVKHGCKYGDDSCPVKAGRVKQQYPCERCQDDIEAQCVVSDAAQTVARTFASGTLTPDAVDHHFTD